MVSEYHRFIGAGYYWCCCRYHFTGAGADTITSGAGNDSIGRDGADSITGGVGADTMTGGAGADHLVFGSVTTVSDSITDFTSGADNEIHSGLQRSWSWYTRHCYCNSRNCSRGITASEFTSAERAQLSMPQPQQDLRHPLPTMV